MDWPQALSTAGERLRAIIDTGAAGGGVYASGQLLTEDYYAANKLMKGFIGAANIDTNSRLCMSSAVAGYKRAFGEDVVPCSYEDVENSDLVVLVGSNAAWTHPVLYQRLVQARQNNPQMKVVVIDPRKTATCDIADLHLALAPGSDAGLFVGLLNLIQVPTTGRLPAWPGFVVLMHRRLPRFTTGSHGAACHYALHHGDQPVFQRQRQVQRHH